MKKVKVLFSILILTFFVSACNERTGITPPEPEFVEVTIPDAYKSNVNGRTTSEDVDDVVLDVQFTTADGKEIVGKVHLVMPDDESLAYFAMTENLLAETGLSPDYWVESLSATPNGRIAGVQGCFAACRDMKKGEGRGACRAECWLDIAVKIATIAAVIL